LILAVKNSTCKLGICYTTARRQQMHEACSIIRS
jgi:hypothetical protein